MPRVLTLVTVISLALAGPLNAQEQDSTLGGRAAPAVVETWLKYFAGSWEFDLGDGRTGQLSYDSAGRTPALVFHGEAEDFSIVGVIGWRADLKMLAETDFHTERKGVHGSLDREFPDITRESIKGSGKFRDSSGQSGSQPLEYRRISDDEMTLTGSQSESGGTAWVVKLKRVK